MTHPGHDENGWFAHHSQLD